MAQNFPPCPQSLKSVQHYLKTAEELEQRDVVVAYWCRLYALQTALKIDKKSEDARSLLVALMDWLEKTKKALADNEAISNEVAAEAHIENYALKLFTWADSQDRAGVFNKNVIKAFYTAGMLMDVLLTFGEHTEEVARNCKYAKWKAAYINSCLKNGETPVPGPLESENDNLDDNTGGNNASDIGFQYPNSGYTPAESPAPAAPTPAARPDILGQNNINTPIVNPASNPVTPTTPTVQTTISRPGGVKLNPKMVAKAQKYCKFASSALDYEDVAEAMNNLQKALHLLETGEDS